MIGTYSIWWYRHRRVTRVIDTLAGWVGLGVICAALATIALAPIWLVVWIFVR